MDGKENLEEEAFAFTSKRRQELDMFEQQYCRGVETVWKK
jgi:hypothetical protein